MKKLILASLICLVSTSAFADGYYPYHHHHYGPRPGYNGGNWAVPLIGGLIIGGIIANEYNRDRCWYEYFYDVDGYRHRRFVCNRYYDHEDYE